jgi:hypothetical protein
MLCRIANPIGTNETKIKKDVTHFAVSGLTTLRLLFATSGDGIPKFGSNFWSETARVTVGGVTFPGSGDPGPELLAVCAKARTQSMAVNNKTVIKTIRFIKIFLLSTEALAGLSQN